MRKFITIVVIFLGLALAAVAQTPPVAAPADTKESYWTVSIHGNYSDVSGAQTNNGVKSGAAIRLGQHFTANADYYSTISPANAKIALVGFEYLGLTHLLQRKPSQFVNLSQFEIGIGPRAGISLQNGARKAAFAFGGHLDRHIANNITLRLLDVSYIRASVLPGGAQIVGNHANVASGLQLQF
jgi:hypothetical protein